MLEELKRAAVEQLARVPDGLHLAIEAAARESSGTVSPIARRDQENALLALRQRNATYVMRFRELVADGFDRFRALPFGARRPAAQLDLVEESQLQYHVAGQRLGDAIALRHAPALQQMERRLEALSAALGQPAAANPVGPVRLAGAFGQTFRDTFLPDSLRPLLFAQYEQRLSQVLSELYARINTVLAEAGYGSGEAPRPAEPPEMLPAANDVPAAEEPARAQDRLGDLRRLLHLWRRGAGEGEGTGTEGTGGGGGQATDPGVAGNGLSGSGVAHPRAAPSPVASSAWPRS